MAKAKSKAKSKVNASKSSSKAKSPAKKAAPKKAAASKAGAKKAAPKKAAAKGKAPVAKKAAALKVVPKTTPKSASKSSSKTGAKKAAPRAKPAKSAVQKIAQGAAKIVAEGAKVISMAGRVRGGKKQDSGLATIFTPLDDRIVVRKQEAANRTPGGLFIPDTVSSSDRPNQGEVVAVGRGHVDRKGRLRPLDVQVGDKVMFSSYTGSEIKVADQELLVIHERDVLAIVKND